MVEAVHENRLKYVVVFGNVQAVHIDLNSKNLE